MPAFEPGVTSFETSGKKMAKSDAPFNSDYGSRKGYDPNFLDKESSSFRIALPVLSPVLIKEVTKLVGSTDYELKYNNFSVVMHRKRRFALYSAANVSYGERYAMNRPRDIWRIDPRIPSNTQVGESYYVRNKFDRGHLTRREDLEYGSTPLAALASAGDTNHFTNCTPQHERFNQNRQIWQGIEFHLLEDSLLNGHFNAQIITGPIFDDSDPGYRNIQYPLQYWKIVAAKNSEGKLFATAFLASQEAVISQYGVKAAVVAPFGPFKNFQVQISEIERLTGLKFVSGKRNANLSRCDPLEHSKTRRQRTISATEAASALHSPHGYVELKELDDIILG
jgi:endonuclease G